MSASDKHKVRGSDFVRVMVRPERVEVYEEICGRLVFCRDFSDVCEAIAFAKSRADEIEAMIAHHVHILTRNSEAN